MRGRSGALIVLLALALAPSGASASPRDTAATHAYILANYALVRASTARIGAAQARVLSVNRKLARECRGAGAGAPENEEAEKMSYEAAGALWSASYSTDEGPIRSFVAAVRGLRWSNPKLTGIARNYAKTLHAYATLPAPDLCSDVRAWSASGFKTIPATTLRFDQRAEAIEGATIPARLLAPYEEPGDKGIVARTEHLETKLLNTETVVGFNDWELVLGTLGLQQ